MKTVKPLGWSFVLMFLLPRVGFPQPSPPGGGGGWDIPTNQLASWTFKDTDNWLSDQGNTPISFTNIFWSYMGNIGSGYSLVVDTKDSAWLQYRVFETNGATNLTLTSGSVAFWFNPDWASASATQLGTGPGTWGRLIEVGSYTANSDYGWWSLFFDDMGTNIYFAAQTNSGDATVSTYLSAPIDWPYGTWHFIALTYSPTNSALYLDGVPAASGGGVTVFPGLNVLTNGFLIGSDSNGFSQASGVFDDLYTYDYPLDASTVSNLYS